MNQSSFYFQKSSLQELPMDFKETTQEDFKEMFTMLDSHKNGKVLINDLKKVMESLGNQGRTSMVYHLLIYHENQGKSYIDYSEFLEIMTQKLNEVSSETDFEKIFSCFDPKLEYIDFDRLQKVANDLNENLEMVDLKQMIKVCDSDKDGKVSFEDFHQMLTTKIVKKNDAEDIRRQELEKLLLRSDVKQRPSPN